MRKKFVAALLCVAMILTLLAGCGSSASSSTAASGWPARTSSPPASAVRACKMRCNSPAIVGASKSVRTGRSTWNAWRRREITWAPVRDLTLRGGYNRAVRAPNVQELFRAQSVQIDGATDPCAGASPTATQAPSGLIGQLVGGADEQKLVYVPTPATGATYAGRPARHGG